MITKKIYLLRHAQTGPNVSGEMVKDYSKCEILPQEPEYWETCRSFINQYLKPTQIFCSNTTRAKQTAFMLYPDMPVNTGNQLDDFDCSNAGPKKFWEMTKEEFDRKVDISYDKILSTIDNLLHNLSNLPDNSLCITHGLLMKALYQRAHYPLQKISLYDLLTKPKKQIYNLDLMEILIEIDDFKISFIADNLKIYSFQDYYTNNFRSTYYD